MSLKKDVIWALRKFGIGPKKGLGQHFLVDEKALEKIISALDPKSKDVILEIGPGIGIMTNLIASRVRKVIGVEKDLGLAEIAKRMARENVEIIYGDFLEMEIPEEVNKIVGNVPYKISSKILEKVVKSEAERSVLTLQLEFAERIVASPGNKKYGRLSVLVQFYCEAEIVSTLPKSSFFPPPKVDSAIVLLKRRERPLVGINNEEHFFRFIKELFGQRRKKVRTILKNLGYRIPGYLGNFLEKRPEELSVVDLGELFKEVKGRRDRARDPSKGL